MLLNGTNLSPPSITFVTPYQELFIDAHLTAIMTISTFLVSMAVTSLCAAQIGGAVPKPTNDSIRSLFKRDQVVFQDCGDPGDPKRIKASDAWDEAAELALFTIEGDLDDGTKFRGTNA